MISPPLFYNCGYIGPNSTNQMMMRVIGKVGMRSGVKMGRYGFSEKKEILSLSQFIQFRGQSDPKYMFQNKSDNLLVFGVDPLRFRLELYVYFKYGHFVSAYYGQQKLISFIDDLNSNLQKIKNIRQNSPQGHLPLEYKQTLEKIQEYQEHLSLTLLPIIIYKMEFCIKYLEQLHHYLSSVSSLDELAITTIIFNFLRIVYPEDNQWEFVSQREYGFLLLQNFDLFIDKLGKDIHQLSGPQKEQIISIAKSLRSQSLPLLQFVKKQLQKDKKQLNLQFVLIGLNFLSINRTFPYEYFYQNKSELMSFVESAYNLSQKKVKNSLFMLQIFSRERLLYCQKIIERLLKCASDNLIAAEVRQLVRLFYFYSRIKSSIDHNFVVSCVQRISIFMNQLSQRDYGLIIKAVSNLNYQDHSFLSSLKAFNYELFLINLKYDCKKIGTYYQAILDQVERTYKESINSQEQGDRQKVDKVEMIF